MSSFIHNRKHFQVIAKGFEQSAQNSQYPDTPFFWLAIPEDLRTLILNSGLYIVMNRLIALNVKSVNKQYKTRKRQFVILRSCEEKIALVEWYVAIQSALYQIENPEFDREIYDLFEEWQAKLAKRIVSLLPEYNAAKWSH